MFRVIYVPLFAGAVGASAAIALPTVAARSASAAPVAASAPDSQSPKPITRAEFLAKVKARFDAIDTNHDGYLEESELAAAQQKDLQHLRAQQQERIGALFDRLDTDHDGQLSKAEFMAAAPPVRARETAVQIIQQLDKHKLGKVTFADYSAGPLAKFDKRAKNGVVTPAAAPSGEAAKPITRAEFLANLKARFDTVDTNHDGYLEENEVAAAQQKELDRAQAIEQQKLEAEFARLDTNHAGQISKAEFLAGAPPVKTRETPQQMIQQLDKHKLGKVSFQDYSARPLSEFDALDTNHDGVVTPQELQAARERAANAATKD